MGMVYDNSPRDNWARLVEAVLRREQFRQLCLKDSRSPSTRSLDSDFSFSSRSQSFSIPPSPRPDSVKPKLLDERKRSGTGKRWWKGLSIFSGFSSSSSSSPKKKNYEREVRELRWAQAQRTLHGLHPPVQNDGTLSKQSFDELSTIAEEAKRRAEIARLRELQTLKGHIESVVRMKGLDIDSIQQHYTL